MSFSPMTVLTIAACSAGLALLGLAWLRRRSGAAPSSDRDPSLTAHEEAGPAVPESSLRVMSDPHELDSPEDRGLVAASGAAGAVSSLADDTDRIFGQLTPVLASLLPEGDSKRQATRQDLLAAGYYQPHAWENLAALRYLGIVVPILFFGLLLVFGPESVEPLAIAGMVVGPAVGWSLPRVVVQIRAGERKREIEQAMPDMLDMVNMCVSQGMTLNAALGRVSHEIKPVYPALSEELAIVTEQARIGTLEQALTNMGQRVDVPEVHSFTSLLTQTERMGTSVSAALADHSDNIRESLRQRADQAANTAAFKLLFPTALFLMPAVFLFLMGPAIVDLTDFFNGEGGAAFRANRAAAQQQLIEFSEEQ